MAGKKEKKKKLTKEERKRLKKEEEERRAREAEEARLQQEEAERMRLEQERLEAEERALRDAEERVLRGMQLITTDETVRDNQSRLTEALSTEYENDRWERYMRCDGLPDPMTRQEVTGYLSSWREMPIEAEQYPEVMRRTDEVLRVIDDLERHVRDKAYGDGELAIDMAAILQQYQDTQTEKLDVATYNLLTDLRPHVDLETNTVQFCSLSRHVSLAVWSNCSKNLKNKGFLFKDLGVRFELPKQLMDKDIAVRIMRTEYDHVSKFCRSQKMLDLAEFRARETLSDVVLEEDIRLEKEREEAKRAAQEQAEREAAEAERLAAEAASAKDKKPGFMSAGSSRSGSPDKSSAPGSPGKSPKGKKKGKKGGKKGKDKSKSRSPKRTPVPDPEPEPQVAAVPSLLVATDKEELNLRRYRVIGGLIHFDLLHIPPQPKVVGAWTLREVCEPRTVRRFPFRADYQPPPPADTLTSRRREPEEIEREIRQQEAEMQKLISTSVDEVSSGSPPPAVAESTTGSVSAADGQVSTAESRASVVAASETASARSMRRSSRRSLSRTGSRVSRVRISAAAGGDGADRDAELSPLPEPGAEEPEPPPPVDYALEVADRPEDFPLVETRLPETTLWFEPPFFVRWDEDESCWSTQGFYDTRYNEENYVLQARTLRLGLFGLAVNRFSNLPYQNWAYAPTGPASGELSITAAVASVRIAIQDDLVSLCEVTGGSSNCLEEYYNKPMKPETFIQTLQRRGLDLFPEEDSYLYIEGSSLKHQPCEKHLYWCMALVGNACGFSSSRWNLLAGADNLVLQFKEMLSQQLQGNPALLLVRPRRTTIVECGETSQSWSDQEAPGMPYFADLYHLVESLGSEEARARVQAAPCTFVNCLHTLFTATRLLSYS